ncbi:hypothetical protein DND132_0411 [Pseudodesulfovibrio mercurii]|uniref:Uncharacterized protein n=1 Tax=Pseudodesulfovibrio mercurii TaxID=641491 RepID=F0JF72_9BACT|nr:hypothetical protein [Pseudodesulfovibrio mercurii]EGB13628.1 hypothetical protein DND132_0411 [Pseudodesulfovibrio mercurii]
MSDLSDFADQLQMDVISDMAESYFGNRKELDYALEAFAGMVEELLPVIERMFRAAATLRLLLLDEATADAFCAELGLDPARIPPDEGAEILVHEAVPFALTGKGRYAVCVETAYRGLYDAIHEYLNGRYYNDPNRPGRKRVTMHYKRLEEIAGIINEKIHKANNDRSMSSMLREVKSMDPVQMEREEILGDMVYGDKGDGRDNDMCFVPIDLDGYRFPEVEELPPVNEVGSALKRFCARVYAERKDEVRAAMDRFRGR